LYLSPGKDQCTTLSNLSATKAVKKVKSSKNGEKVVNELLKKRNAPSGYKQIGIETSASKIDCLELSGKKKLKIDEILPSDQKKSVTDKVTKKNKKIQDLLCDIKAESINWDKINFGKNVVDHICASFNLIK